MGPHYGFDEESRFKYNMKITDFTNETICKNLKHYYDGAKHYANLRHFDDRIEFIEEAVRIITRVSPNREIMKKIEDCFYIFTYNIVS